MPEKTAQTIDEHPAQIGGIAGPVRGRKKREGSLRGDLRVAIPRATLFSKPKYARHIVAKVE